MEQWRHLLIGDLCDAGVVELQTGPFGSQLHAHEYVAAGVPVVPTEAIRDQRINHEVLPHVSEAKAHELARHRLNPGDILFARRGVQATGHTALVREGEAGFVCGTGAIRLRFLPANQELDPAFLSHVLANPAAVEWFKFHAIGATMPNLNEGIIRAFSFACPPRGEQQAIASILSALNDKIELNRRMNETLEAMARALFKDWFVDFGPTRAKMEGRAPYLAQDIWSLFPDRLDESGKPEGWSVVPLVSLIEVNPLEKLSRGTLAPYLDMASIPTVGPNPAPYVVREFGSGMRFRNGDALLARITPCLENGKTAFVQSLPEGAVAWGSTEFIVLRSRPPVPSAVAYLVARDPAFRAAAIRSMTGTSGRQRASNDAISAYPMTRPDNGTLWSLLSNLVAPIFERIVVNDKESQSLAAVRDLLLPRLMSGEIRLRDAEKMVEAVA